MTDPNFKKPQIQWTMDTRFFFKIDIPCPSLCRGSQCLWIVPLPDEAEVADPNFQRWWKRPAAHRLSCSAFPAATVPSTCCPSILASSVSQRPPRRSQRPPFFQCLPSCRSSVLCVTAPTVPGFPAAHCSRCLPSWHWRPLYHGALRLGVLSSVTLSVCFSVRLHDTWENWITGLVRLWSDF